MSKKKFNYTGVQACYAMRQPHAFLEFAIGSVCSTPRLIHFGHTGHLMEAAPIMLNTSKLLFIPDGFEDRVCLRLPRSYLFIHGNPDGKNRA